MNNIPGNYSLIIMKKAILTVLVVTIGFVGFAQDNGNTPKRLKYLISAPDGSVGITIYDNTLEDNLKLESANNFYRYEILDQITSEPVLSLKNNGNECTIDKTKVESGTYNLRLYTSNFVITSEITIMDVKRINSSLQPTVAIIASK